MNKQKFCAPMFLRTSNGCEAAGLIATGEASASGNVTRLPITTRALERDDCEPDQGKINLVRKLRLLFQQSLLKPRCNWDAACTLIAADPKAKLEDYATAFFHGLEIHAVHRFRPFVTWSVRTSFDELWLVQIVGQVQAGNIENAHYLIATRVRHQGRRRLLFLAEGLAAGLTGS